MAKTSKAKVKVPMQEAIGTLTVKEVLVKEEQIEKAKDVSKLLKNMLANPHQLLDDVVVPGLALQVINEDKQGKYFVWSEDTTQKKYFTARDLQKLEAGLAIKTWAWAS